MSVEPEDHDNNIMDVMSNASMASIAAVIMMSMVTPDAAMAVASVATPDAAVAVENPLVEVFKTMPANLLHPAVMFAMFGGAVYTAYLGWQVRQIRTTDDKETKKRLVEKKPAQKHFANASAIMAITTFFTFEGMANTFNRAGKLFPGPHLYAGLGLVTTLTVLASLVPSMQKGNIKAREAHLAVGALCLGLFAWQAQTGLEIVGKLTKLW